MFSIWITFVIEKKKKHSKYDILILEFEPPHKKTNKMACAPSEDSDQPGHPSSLLRVFAVHSMGS